VTWIKICGITSAADARLAVDEGADALGFIFHPKSKRYIAPLRAAEITAGLPRHVMRVGVFVDAPLTVVQRVCGLAALDLAQVHGNETPAYVAALGNGMKAFRAGVPAQRIGGYAGLILLDGPSGGSGQAADLALARQCARHRPVVLAGGLTPENVAQRIRAVRPFGVDVASGTEAAPGRKDPARLRAFIRAARAA
jgi:phosphoribosylanthranilate isomerase